jgi:GNAT superfamily N-acetyltransferase
VTSDTPNSSTSSLSAVERLSKEHILSEFNCGKPALDDWLKRFSLANQQNDSARTFVVHCAKRVVGYYSLAAGSVRREESPQRIPKGLAKHPIGIILLARLAVDHTERATGLGRLLLRDALLRCASASEAIGARAVLVHATDEETVSFYRKFGFEASPLDPRQLMLLMKDLRATLESSGHK